MLALRQIARCRGGGGGEENLLPALLEDVRPEQFQALKESSTADDLIVRACAALIRADQIWQALAPEQRVRLRCFSPDLLALAADHAFRLVHLRDHRTRAVEEFECAKVALHEAAGLATGLVTQSAIILRKVEPKGATGPNGRTEGPAAPATVEENALLLARALIRTAVACEHVMSGGRPAVRQRALLFGLDDSYVQSLRRVSTRLTGLVAEVQRGGELASVQASLDRAHAVTAFLLEQVCEAFALARALDSRIPELVPGAGPSAVSRGPGASGDRKHSGVLPVARTPGTALPDARSSAARTSRRT